MKLRKGDKVKIIYGKDKGRDGIIEKVYKKQGKILVGGVNIYKKHVKKSEQFPQGGVVEVSRPLDISKVMLICPSCKEMTRINFEIRDGKKVRVCHKCKSII